ncbi:hypothetical protein Glove_50g10 [Diversispora epigaea]|uniref:Uncharacterized protein n=1 Tax=Diversispora epigaea TaxID=1348612 RepID=A0A397JER2_9GLOM|nr:hypothetical protein Glove_50g10 [Diversispora epigaea]
MLGKCVYVPSNTNSQCKCLRFRASNDQYICAACSHDESYHELNNNNNNNNNNTTNQLNSIFRPIRPENNDVAPIFNPSEATGRYFSRNTNTRRRRFNDITNFTVTVFCLTGVDSNEVIKIPRSGGTKYRKMIEDSCIKEITFAGTNLELIDTKIESEFAILRNKNWIVYRPSGSDLFPIERINNPYTHPTIKRIAGSRKKLYIGLLNNNEQEELETSSSSHNVTSTIGKFK